MDASRAHGGPSKQVSPSHLHAGKTVWGTREKIKNQEAFYCFLGAYNLVGTQDTGRQKGISRRKSKINTAISWGVAWLPLVHLLEHLFSTQIWSCPLWPKNDSLGHMLHRHMSECSWKGMKMYSTLLAWKKDQVKSQWASTACSSEQLKSGRPTTASVGEDGEPLELPYAADGHVKWYNHSATN